MVVGLVVGLGVGLGVGLVVGGGLLKARILAAAAVVVALANGASAVVAVAVAVAAWPVRFHSNADVDHHRLRWRRGSAQRESSTERRRESPAGGAVEGRVEGRHLSPG